MPPYYAIESLAIDFQQSRCGLLVSASLRSATLHGPYTTEKTLPNASALGKALTLPAALLYFPRDLTSSFLH